MLKITIDTDGAAFQPLPGEEVSRILIALAGQFCLHKIAAIDTFALRDCNGNTVGRVEVS
jgi:hypothetical protein